MINILPTPKKTSYFQREYMYNGETVHTSLDSLLGKEEYILEITFEDGITIIGGSEQAVFYGECTLEQILKNNSTRLPAMKIEDEPVFAYRGFMIDCARHFFSVDELKAIIDTMARMKFNKFHWHLTDDQGFRMEIRCLPKLHREGSVRNGSNFGKVHENGEYGGYYTREQMEDIVAFCAERFIDVVPEIDIPGHTSAMIHAYPEMSCRNRKIKVKTTQGIFKDILCAGNEKTYENIFQILDEMCEIFPGNIYHIGGDEAPKDIWSHCSACKNEMKRLGLSNFDELQCAMSNKIIAYLEKKGKTVICWNDILKGGNLSKNAIIEHWMDRNGSTLDWANRGRKVIMSDFFHYYFDYPYAMTPLKKTYSYKPFFKKMDVRGKENVIGVECCLWSEHIGDNGKLEYMLFPRACAVAETAWGHSGGNYNEFLNALKSFNYIFRENKLTPAPKNELDPNIIKRIFGSISFANSIKQGKEAKAEKKSI